MHFIIRAALAGLALVLAGSAGAEDRANWFKSLKQPQSGASCCDISDCRQTQAKWSGTQWVAVVRGYPRAIPPEKVLSQPHSIDGEAYVCASEYGYPEQALIYCFIPPTMGF